MDDLSGAIDDLRLDVETLRTMIDVALDQGVRGEDDFLRACAAVLHERRVRLEHLERANS